MRPEDFVGVSGVPLIQALVAGCKRTFPQVPDQYWPGVSVAWGVALNLALAYLLHLNYAAAALAGLVAGLLSSGLYAWGKDQASWEQAE